MEPVQIDFIYGGNTEAEGEKIEQSMDNIANASKKAQADITKAAAAQAAVIKQIEADIKGLEKQLSQAAPGNAKSALIDELKGAKRALNEEKAALNDVNASIENTAQKHTRLRTQVMEAKQALSEMEMQGKRGTAEYAAAADELGRLNNQMGDTTMQAKILADDQKGFRAVASGVSGLAGAMTAATGITSLFGAENEELVRIQTRLQAVMAISIGVQQVSEMLNKDSYFSVVLLTKAKMGWAAANLKVAATLGITTAASKLLMLTGIGVIIAAIGGLIYLYDKWSKKQEEQKKLAVDNAKLQKEYADSISKGYAEEQSKIEAMRAALNSENVSRTKKLDIIKQLSEKIPGYTAELNKEGNVIRENKKAVDEYMISLEKSLRLRAAEKELAAIYEKKFTLEKLVVPDDKSSGPFAIKKSELTPIEQMKKTLSDGAKVGIKQLEEDEKRIKEKIESGGLVDIKTIKDVKSKASKETYDSEQAITDLILNIRARRAKLEIDQQTDSLQKRLAAVKLDRDNEIQQIDDQQAAIVKAYNKAHKGDKNFVPKTTVGQIDPKLAEQIAAEKVRIAAAYGKKEANETEKYQQEITELVMSFADERTQIAYNYNKDIDKANEMGLTTFAARMEKEKQNRIKDITLGLIEETELYKVASDDKLQISKAMTEALIADLQKRIDAEIAAGKLSKAEGEKWLADLNKVQKEISDKKNQNNPFAQLGTAISGNSEAQKAYKNAPVGTSIEELAKLQDAANKARASMASAAAEALNGVNAILGSVVDGLDRLGLLTEEQKKDADNIMGMVGGAANIAMGIATGNPIAIIQGSIDLLVNGIEFFDFKNKALEKSQKQHLKNVDDLELKYKKLQRAVETALGTDIYKAQRDQIENNKKQIAEYEAWLILEGQKKQRKQDAAKIAETKAKIDELKNSIEDEAKAIAEALAQTDAKSLAGELADAITTAFANGEDAALAFGNVAEQVMQNAVKNALKLQFLEKPMQNAVDQLSKDMESGNQLTDAEQAAFRKKIEDAGKIYYEQLAQYSDLFTGQASTQTGIKGDVSKMTEETGSALVGQITAMRLNVVALLNNSKSSLETTGKVLATLEKIKDNTDRLNRIDETLYYIKQNGLKVI